MSLREPLRPIAAWLDAHRSGMLEFAGDLVAIPSENPPGNNYQECIARIERELERLALPAERLADGLVVQSAHGTGRRPLYLSGHYDVVPAQSQSQFEPELTDDSLTGRGSGDMKGGIAAMLYSVAAIASRDSLAGGRIILRCVPDEESGGARGTRALAESGLIDRSAIGMLTPEPTSGVIWNASRGAVTWRLTTHGRAAHVGLHYQGESSFDAMLDVVSELRSLKKEISRRETQFPVSAEEGRASIMLIGGRVEGGTNYNVVPDECSFTVDRRLNPEESLDAERSSLLACIAAARARGVDVTVEVLQEGNASATSHETTLATALADSITEVTGARPRFELCPGLLETRFYSALGIPALAFGPGELELAHGPNESVRVSRICDVALIYADTIMRALSG